jgi:hypothetical protein
MATFVSEETIVNTTTVSIFGAVTGNSGSPSDPFYEVPAGRYAEAYIIRKSGSPVNFGDLKFSKDTTNLSKEYHVINVATNITGGQDMILMDQGDYIYRDQSGNYSVDLYIFIKEFSKP